MYKEIKNKFKEITPLYKIDIMLKMLSIAFCLIYLIIYFLSTEVFKTTGWIHSFIMIISFLLCFILIIIIFSIYYYKKIKQYIPKNTSESSKFRTIKNKFIIARDKYNYEQKEKYKKELINLLREYNINSQDKIKLLIEYYRRYLPNINQKSIFYIFGSTFSFSFTILLTVLNSENPANILATTLLLALIIASIWSLTNALWRFFQITINDTANYYLEIEETLTKVYLNFEAYENQLLNSKK